ncbi:phosphodiester glycosidase family protein [Nocardiopsis coralliicola]
MRLLPPPSKRLTAVASATAAALLLALASPGAASAAGRAVPVAPGAGLARPEGTGDPMINLLSVSSAEGAAFTYADSGAVSEPAAVSDLAEQTDPGAGRTVAAAANGGYFDLGGTEAPLGAAVRNGDPLVSPSEGYEHAVVIGADGRGTVEQTALEGTAELPGAAVELDALNAPLVPDGGLGVYTGDWGEAPRSGAVEGAGRVAEAVIEDGRVSAVSDRAGGAVEDGSRVLLGSGAAAEQLAALEKGDPVGIDYRITAGGAEPHTVLGGREVLLRDGEPVGAPDEARHPRTAIGFSADGTQTFAATSDGRVPGLRGATLGEMAEALRAAGAHDAIELDGGGSSTLLARNPGGLEPLRRNRTGGEERAVPNALVMTVPEGDGAPAGVWVRPGLADTATAGDPHRVFTGMRRGLAATVYDRAYGPAENAGTPELAAERGTVDGTVFTAGPAGQDTVTGTAGGVRGELAVEVLAAPESIAATPGGIAFADAGAGPVELTVSGAAPDGGQVPIDPADVEVAADPGLAAIERTGDAFTVAPAGAGGAGTITVRAGGAETAVPVSVGGDTAVLADFADAAEWTANGVRAEAGIRAVPGRTGTAAALSYDFTQSGRTRSAEARPPHPIEVDGRAAAFGVAIRGDGGGAQAVLGVVDAEGQSHSLYGPSVEPGGWTDAVFDVPAGIAQPLTVERVYLVETDPARSYTGDVAFDDLTAEIAPEP